MSAGRRALFLDSTVLLHAVGGDDPARAPSRAVLALASRGEVLVHASVEMVQEVVHHRLRRGTAEEAVALATDAAGGFVLHPFDEAVQRRALALVRTGAVRGRDAVHAATALEAGFDAIVTTDKDFDHVPGLRRIDPADLV